MTPLHLLPLTDSATGRTNAVIDTPRGSRAKYKYDEATGQFRLHKLLPRGMAFPFNFGFLPSTRGEDGDALDIMLLMEESIPPGVIVPVRVIGVLAAEQTGRDGKTLRNDRFIGIVDTDVNPAGASTLSQVDDGILSGIEHFFVTYNDKEGRVFKPLGRYGADEAHKLLHPA